MSWMPYCLAMALSEVALIDRFDTALAVLGGRQSFDQGRRDLAGPRLLGGSRPSWLLVSPVEGSEMRIGDLGVAAGAQQSIGEAADGAGVAGNDSLDRQTYQATFCAT